MTAATQTLCSPCICCSRLKTSAFPLRKEGNLCHKNQCLLWQIRFFWLKNVLFIVLWGCHWALVIFGWHFLLWFWSYFWGQGMGPEGHGEGCGNCVITRFLKDSLIQFSIIDWCQCSLLRSTLPSLQQTSNLLPFFVINKHPFPVTPVRHSPGRLRL